MYRCKSVCFICSPSFYTDTDTDTHLIWYLIGIRRKITESSSSHFTHNNSRSISKSLLISYSADGCVWSPTLDSILLLFMRQNFLTMLESLPTCSCVGIFVHINEQRKSTFEIKDPSLHQYSMNIAPYTRIGCASVGSSNTKMMRLDGQSNCI